MAGDVLAAVLSAALSLTPGGTTDFVKAGFGTPKACMVVVSFDAVDDAGVAVEGKVSIGFSDFTDDFCITHQDEDGSAKVDSDARKSNTRSYVVLNAAGAVLFSGTASAIADGVRLTHTAGEAPASAFFATVTMFGGADLAVSLQRSAIASTLNGTATIPHSGFTDGNDKLIYFIGTDIAGEDSSSSGINSAFGVCHAAGSDAGGWAFVQRCLGWASDHNNNVGSPHAIMSTDRVLDMITEAGGQDWGLEVTGLDHAPAEWTVTTRDAGAGAGMEVYSLALDIDDRGAKVGSVDGPISGATWTPAVALGFTPQFVMLGLTDLTSENAIASDAEAGVLGLSLNAGSGEEACHSWYDEDASAAANTNNLFRSRVIDLRDHDVSTVLQDHSHSSFNVGDWTYTINAENETVAKKWFYAALEEAAVAQTFFESHSMTATGAVVMANPAIFARSFAMTATGAAALSKSTTFAEALSFSAIGTVGLLKTIRKSLSMAAVGTVGLVRTVAKSFAMTATGTVSSGQAFIGVKSFSISASGDVTFAKEFIAGAVSGMSHAIKKILYID